MNKIVLAIVFITQIQAIEIVDSYLEQGEIRKAVNRLYFLAKDIRNFTCIKSRLNCILPNDIVTKIIQIRNKSFYKKEQNIIDNFFRQNEIQKNLFITSYLSFLDINYSESKSKLDKILINYPSNLYALNQKVIILNLTEEFNKTEELHKKLIKIQPKNPDSYFQLISLYLKQENIDLAESQFTITKEKFPKNSRLKIYRKKIDDSYSTWTKIYKYIF